MAVSNETFLQANHIRGGSDMLMFFLSLVFIWILWMIVQSYTYLNRYEISFSFLGTVLIPIMLFILHFSMFWKESNKKKGFKFLAFYFFYYKLSLIFLTELILENVAMVESVGYSPYLSKVKPKETKPVLERVKELLKLPETENSFEEIILAV